jgi:hypothetical protein
LYSDRGSADFATVITSASNTSAEWQTIWLAPDDIDTSQTVRYHITTPQGRHFDSPPFTVGDVMKETRPVTQK